MLLVLGTITILHYCAASTLDSGLRTPDSSNHHRRRSGHDRPAVRRAIAHPGGRLAADEDRSRPRGDRIRRSGTGAQIPDYGRRHTGDEDRRYTRPDHWSADVRNGTGIDLGTNVHIADSGCWWHI